jgi:hypothetical protein
VMDGSKWMGEKSGCYVLPYSKKWKLGRQVEYHDKMLLKKDYAEKCV